MKKYSRLTLCSILLFLSGCSLFSTGTSEKVFSGLVVYESRKPVKNAKVVLVEKRHGSHFFFPAPDRAIAIVKTDQDGVFSIITNDQTRSKKLKVIVESDHVMVEDAEGTTHVTFDDGIYDMPKPIEKIVIVVPNSYKPALLGSRTQLRD